MTTVDHAPSADTTTPDGLVRLGGKESVRSYLRELWGRRQYATVVPLGDLRAQNMDTVLGNVWHLLNPLFLIGVYYLLFEVILDISRGGVENFITFLTVGIIGFHWTQKTVIAGAGAVVGNEGLIRSIRFPRAILPISTVVGQTLAFLPGVGVMVLVALATGEPPRLTWFYLIPIFVLQAVFNLGACFVAARMTDMFRDFQNVLPYVFRLLFYMSGVLYPVGAFIDDGLLQRLFNANPMYAFISLVRGPILGSPMYDGMWLSAVSWTVGLLIAGFLFFRAGEGGYGRG